MGFLANCACNPGPDLMTLSIPEEGLWSASKRDDGCGGKCRIKVKGFRKQRAIKDDEGCFELLYMPTSKGDPECEQRRGRERKWGTTKEKEVCTREALMEKFKGLIEDRSSAQRMPRGGTEDDKERGLQRSPSCLDRATSLSLFHGCRQVSSTPAPKTLASHTAALRVAGLGPDRGGT